MLIISVRDNRNNRWGKKKKKTAKKQNKTKTEKNKGTEAIAKRGELNDFVVRLS